MIDGIDQSMNNYRDLVKMGQIDDSEREGVLENIGRNERKLEAGLEKDNVKIVSRYSYSLLTPWKGRLHVGKVGCWRETPRPGWCHRSGYHPPW